MLKKNKINIFLFLLLSLNSFSQVTINQLDANGKRHGLWKGIYEESKRPRYEGTFDHGKEIGVFKYFDDTKAGKVIATRDFTKGENTCYVTIFDRKENIVSQGLLINKKEEGEWKFFHKESKIPMTIAHYKEGVLHGEHQVFYRDGSLAESVFYKNGKKEGVYKKFGENEKPLEIANYKNNEYHGLVTFYDGTGNKAVEGNYKNGLRIGVWKTYENGKLVKEENFSKKKSKEKENNK